MMDAQMGMFWLAAAAIGLGVAGALVLALLRGREAGAPTAEFDLRVYRDQLAEVERDLARGVLAEDEAGRLRTEVSRRLLDADRALQGDAAVAGKRGAGPMAALFVVAVLVAAVWGYMRLGAPGYPDMPLAERIAMAEDLRASRPAQAEVEADISEPALPEAIDPQYLELMAKLREAVAARPLDIQGQELLAQNEARLGRFGAAYKAQEQVIALREPKSTAEDHAVLAELMIMAARGYVSPEAEAALTEALRRDPMNGTALYYSGVLFAQIGRPDQAFALWRGLLESSVPGDPWVAPLRAQIGEMALRAGVNYRIPEDVAPGMDPNAAPALAGPSTADIEAAAEMTEGDRTAMIEGMVAQLSQRLATEGGSAQEWARLIGAYGVLGQTERARAIWTEAQGRFAEKADDLALLRAAAEAAGVAE